MAIPVTALGSRASVTNLLGPLAEFSRSEINRLKGEITGESGGSSRSDPTHVGLGLGMHIPTSSGTRSEGIACNIDARLDLLSLEIDEQGPDVSPSQITPAFHISNTLTAYDEFGEQDWLLGGPLCATRMRSMQVKLHCNKNEWNSEVVLEDASYLGNIDSTAEIPGQMALRSSGQNSDIGFGETVSAMLEYRQDELAEEGTEAEIFLRTLEFMEIAVPPDLSSNVQPWTINESNLTTLSQDPNAYLHSIICDPQGDWNLSKPLNNGQSILQIFATLLPHSTIVDLPGDPRNESLCIPLPFTSYIGAELFLHPIGYLEIVVDGYPMGGTSLSATIGMDLAGSEPASSSDGIALTADVKLQLTKRERGLFAGAYLHLTYDESLVIGEQLILDLHLPKLGAVLAPLHNVDTVDDGDASWIPTPDSVRLHPPPTVGGQTLGAFLSTTSPTVILDTVVCLAIDAYLLSGLREDGVLGEVMEVLDLVEQHSDGRYTCTSLLDFLRAPRAYLESIFILNGGINVSKVIQFAGALMRAFDLPYYEGSIVFELGRAKDSVFAEIAIMVHPQNANGITLSFRSPSQSTTSPLELDFDFRANLTPGPVFDIDGTSITLTARPNELIVAAGGSSTTFLANSFISVTAELIQGTLHVSMDLNIDGTNTSHVTLLPNISGFANLLSSALGSVLPNLLSLLLSKKLTNVTIGSSTLGDILIGYFHELNLWNAPTGWTSGAITLRDGSIDGPLVTSIASNPRQWLMGPDPTDTNPIFAVGALEDVLIGGVRAITSIVIDNSSNLYVTNVQTSSTNTVTITVNDYPNLEITIGKNSSDFGIWIGISPDVRIGPLTAGNSPPWTLDIELQAGCTFEFAPFRILPNVSLGAKMLHPFAESTALRIAPALSFSWNPNDEFVLEAATDQKGTSVSGVITWDDNGTLTGNGFWIKWQSNASTPIQCGMPDITSLVTGAIDIILGFIEGIDEVQDWLAKPLMYSDPNKLPEWYDTNNSTHGGLLQAVQVLTTPCEIADAFGLMREGVTANAEPPYVFEDVSGIMNSWVSDPLGNIFDAIFTMIETALGPYAELPIYHKNEGDFKFMVSIVDKNVAQGIGTFGIAIDFEEAPPIELGKLRLKLYSEDPNGWVNARNPNPSSPRVFKTGAALYFADWSSTAGVTPNLSLEIAGIGARLYRADGKPILDKILTLNTVDAAVALDVNIVPTASVEVGAQLVLDDFGIALGGGDSDGGNGMAKGLLSGGEDGKDAVQPIFDIAVSKYDQDPIHIQMRGETEFWFPVNKEFGPVSIAQIGVKYWQDSTKSGPNIHRLSIMVDGEADVAGFRAQVDDLGVNFPLLRPLEFSDWEFELKGLAISFTKGDLSIAGALRKESAYAYFPASETATGTALETIINNQAPEGTWPADMAWALPYVDYQGLCTITTSKFCLSAVGAFARVPKPDGSGFVSCFVIAALDMPIGGPPMFYITGLLGGLGLNRGLALPDINTIDQNMFIQALGGSLASDPMAALERIRTDFPVEHGSFWLAVGVKFTSFKVIETRAVLYAKFSDSFTIGLIGLSTMDLPDPENKIAHIELGLMAYYDSGENVLWVQAQLTDASYLFHPSCRLMGGFALVTWFNTGDFVLSLGGYHPGFQTPSHYPIVPRIGFSWIASSKLSIKGGMYFTLCSSAVMLGARLEASYKSGKKLSASFAAGFDVLIIFDPFKYDFNAYIGLSVKYGRLGFNVGADLHLMGPKMHGSATIELAVVKFTVNFGDSTQRPAPIAFQTFVNRHVRQIDNDEASLVAWLNSDEWFSAAPTYGVIRSVEDGELPVGSLTDPWKVGPEFDLNILTKFPNENVEVGGITSDDLNQDSDSGFKPDGQLDQSDAIHMAPTAIASIDPFLHLNITQLSGNTLGDLGEDKGLSISRVMGMYPATLWTPSPSPPALPNAKPPCAFLDGGVIRGRITFEDGGEPIAFEGNIEPCEMNMHLPLEPCSAPLSEMLQSMGTDGKVTIAVSYDPSYLDSLESMLESVSPNTQQEFRTEVETVSSYAGKGGAQ